MKTIPIPLIPILALLFLSPLTAHSWAEELLPIKGRFTGTVSFTPLSQTEPLYRLENVALGRLSHLGRSEARWVIPRLEFDLVGKQLIVAEPNWTGIITAASGDQIIGRYSFDEPNVSFTGLGDVTFLVHLEVIDGTGRFDGTDL